MDRLYRRSNRPGELTSGENEPEILVANIGNKGESCNITVIEHIVSFVSVFKYRYSGQKVIIRTSVSGI